jgi:mercuric ion transport protein
MSTKEADQTATGASSQPPINTAKWLAGAGLVAGAGAVVASSCCVLPIGLAALGAGAGVFGVLNEVAAWRIPFLIVSALAIASGWGMWWIKRGEDCPTGSHCAAPSRTQSTASLLILASFIGIAAASWAYIEPVLLKFFKGV